jgi:tetratricopeptide (TPR) repeat protein
MKRTIINIALTLLTVASAFAAKPANQQRPADTSTRKERNFVRDGNALYKSKHYPEAEVAYKKALEENPNSEAALYNLAMVYIRTSGPNATGEGENDPMKEAQSILTNLARSSQDPDIAERANYNLGNLAFNSQNYDQAIDMYKNALRRNPNNDLTRENLRLAQLKRKEQQDQQQDKNQDQNQDQDKQQQQQQNQDNNKDQQDQNKDQQQPQQPKQDQQQQQKQQGGISDSNAEKILKTMENEENATRRRVQEMERKEGQARQRTTGPQW